MTGGGSQSTYGTGTGSDSARGSYSTPGTQDPQGATKDDTGRGYTGSRETGATGVLKTSCVLEQHQHANTDPAQCGALSCEP